KISPSSSGTTGLIDRASSATSAASALNRASIRVSSGLRATRNGIDGRIGDRARSAGPVGSDELQEDEDDETDEGERLGEGDAEEHRGLDLAGRLGLAGQ